MNKKKLSNIDLSIISIMSVIACTGRILLSSIPNVEILIPIIILSSAYFKKYYGIFISIISILISNVFLGQGIWTIWQITACIIISLVTNNIFFKKSIVPNHINLSIFSLFSTILIYSPIINLLSILFYFPNPNKELIISYILTSLPFDILHSISNSIFVFIIHNPFIFIVSKVNNNIK